MTNQANEMEIPEWETVPSFNDFKEATGLEGHLARIEWERVFKIIQERRHEDYLNEG